MVRTQMTACNLEATMRLVLGTIHKELRIPFLHQIVLDVFSLATV